MVVLKFRQTADFLWRTKSKYIVSCMIGSSCVYEYNILKVRGTFIFLVEEGTS